ncbi:MAG TPA: anti-sigma regulatory factor [Desulfobacteraceae bacterium]|nr:anti-sigma regulatory factor [Deltaproteobacteria bacterium]MBW2355874.1 anti-sigma regulatory factor [Deltaproteobacteria bacterium]HDI60339.1 anti-sigma regulatory factor [Desulfobacteraceae bacterium]
MTEVGAEIHGKLRIAAPSDVVAVRKNVRELAAAMGFNIVDSTRLVTAAAELARNVIHYAGAGELTWKAQEDGKRKGLRLEFVDQGPGIADPAQAMTPGYSTSGGLGMGLPGAKRLADEMEIRSEVGRGTTVVITQWLPL